MSKKNISELDCKQQIGWKVPEEVFTKFKDFCDDSGLRYNEALAAAMSIWPLLSPTVQRAAIYHMKNISPIDADLIGTFLKGFEQALSDRAYSLNRKSKVAQK